MCGGEFQVVSPVVHPSALTSLGPPVSSMGATSSKASTLHIHGPLSAVARRDVGVDQTMMQLMFDHKRSVLWHDDSLLTQRVWILPAESFAMESLPATKAGGGERGGLPRTAPMGGDRGWRPKDRLGCRACGQNPRSSLGPRARIRCRQRMEA